MKEYKYRINGNEYAVAVNEVCDTTAKVTVNGEEYTVEWEKPVEEKPVVKVQPAAAKPAAAAPAPAAKPTAAPAGGHGIKTPLPGVIIDVKVNIGERPDSSGARSHENGEQHQCRPRRKGHRNTGSQGRHRCRRFSACCVRISKEHKI